MQLLQGPRDNNVALLEREQVDVVMSFESANLVTAHIGFRPLSTNGLCCVVRTDSALAELQSLGPEDVAGYPQVMCLPPSLRRHGSASQAEIPSTDPALTTHCSTSSEAYCLVDSGFGYALVPALYSMPDPFHRVIPWSGTVTATYGFFHRIGARAGMVPHFARVAEEVFGQDAFARPLHETWRPS